MVVSRDIILTSDIKELAQMNLRKHPQITFSIVFIFLAFLLPLLSHAQETRQVKSEDLKEVVTLMEDPQKREAFVKDLKHIIQAKEESTAESKKEKGEPTVKKEREVLFVENLFMRFEAISKGIIDAAASTTSLIARTPETYGKIKSFFSEPEKQGRFLKLLADIAAAILIALIIRFFLRNPILRMAERTKTTISGFAKGIFRIILVLLPYAALLASLFIMFKILPPFSLGQSLALLFFVVLLFYRMTVELFRVLLSPDDSGMRLLSISDENANYYWVWMIRFTNYTAFYFLLTGTFLIFDIPHLSYAFIRGLLLIVFPLMISVIILQVAREIRMRFEAYRKNAVTGPDTETATRKMLSPVVQHWSILAVAYSWAIFLFLIIQYDNGFRYLFSATFWTAVMIIALLLSLRLQELLFKKFFAINERVKERFPGLEAKTNRYILILRKIVRSILVILGLGIIAQVWGIPMTEMVASEIGSLIILRAITILITIGAVAAVMEITQGISDHFLKGKKKGRKKKEATQKIKTLIPMIRTAIKIAVVFIGGIIVLDRLGINTTPILAGAGIVGLAVGFGSQTLVKDLINGLFILFEESIRVGDYADLGKNEGIVEAVGLRTVKLRDVYGNVHVVPNSSIETLTNMSKGFSRAVMDIGVAYKEDVDEVMEIMREVGEEMRNDQEIGKGILEPIEIFGLQKFDDSAVVIRARMTTKPLKQWGLKREFNRRIKKVFDQRGIEIPFPHQTIYMGEPKEGKPAPMHVHLEKDVDAKVSG
jgi:moderate conductance mechanosensitive channel